MDGPPPIAYCMFGSNRIKDISSSLKQYITRIHGRGDLTKFLIEKDNKNAQKRRMLNKWIGRKNQNLQ